MSVFKDFTFRDLTQLILIPIITAGVTVAWKLNSSVSELNTNFTVVGKVIQFQETQIKELKMDHKELKAQVRELELKKYN